MHIAHFTYEYPPSTTGGLGTYIEELVRYHHASNDNVDVFFLGENDAPAGTYFLPFYIKDKLQFYSIDHISRLTKKDMVKYDALVCHDWAGILVCQPIVKQFTPLITTCHLPLNWDIGDYSDLPCKFDEQLEFYAMAQSDLIITVSQSAKDFITFEYPFTHDKTAVIYNGIDTNYFIPGKQSSHPFILFVGRFVEQKGVDLLPDIFFELKKRHPDLSFKLIGTGPLKIEIIERFKNKDLISCADIYDFSDRKTILDLYQRASIVIMPSRFEPFGLVAIESMSTRTPVVASNVGGLKEIITDKEDGYLVEKDNINNFIEVISYILMNKRISKKIGINARQTVIEKFDKNICFSKTRDLYSSLILEYQKNMRSSLGCPADYDIVRF